MRLEPHTTLVHNPRNQALSENTELITVYIARGQPEAEIVKGRLESEGVPAILRYESAGVVYGLTIDGLGQVEVQVPSYLAKQAREILATEENEGY
jgi:hypothetical protein